MYLKKPKIKLCKVDKEGFTIEQNSKKQFRKSNAILKD